MGLAFGRLFVRELSVQNVFAGFVVFTLLTTSSPGFAGSAGERTCAQLVDSEPQDILRLAGTLPRSARDQLLGQYLFERMETLSNDQIFLVFKAFGGTAVQRFNLLSYWQRVGKNLTPQQRRWLEDERRRPSAGARE